MQNLIPIAAGRDVNTREDVKAYFQAHGITVHGWAKRNQFSRNVVKELIYGRGKGHHGQSHHVAIALGMKLPPSEEAPDVMLPRHK
ncbi:MAG: hypothetical protein KDI44_16310 [Thiothrix sp.]|nr:hypothetical protein [Thiothrix sp.]